MTKVHAIDAELMEILRWPEAVTFEELNQEEPSWFLRSVLKFAYKQGWDKETIVENLPELAKVAQEAGLLKPNERATRHRK